jgi:predicted metal-dependent hydrolase
MTIQDVRIIRSPKRKKTVSARLEGSTLIVSAPARISQRDLDAAVRSLRARLERRADQAEASRSDEALEARAHELNRELFGGRLHWQSIRYVSNQSTRWGSCTSLDGTIRLSERLRDLPAWVRDYVLVHEMAHLEQPDHSAAFWALCNRYPLMERARGYLMALDHLGGRTDGEGEVK